MMADTEAAAMTAEGRRNNPSLRKRRQGEQITGFPLPDEPQRCDSEYEPGRVCRRDYGHDGDHSRVRFNADEDESLR